MSISMWKSPRLGQVSHLRPYPQDHGCGLVCILLRSRSAKIKARLALREQVKDPSKDRGGVGRGLERARNTGDESFQTRPPGSSSLTSNATLFSFHTSHTVNFTRPSKIIPHSTDQLV